MDKEDRKNMSNGLIMVSQMGVTSLVCIMLSLLIGFWLDRWLGVSPLFLIIFSLLGGAAAIKAMIDIAKKF